MSKVVFVIGAGASACFGISTGSMLSQKIASYLRAAYSQSNQTINPNFAGTPTAWSF